MDATALISIISGFGGAVVGAAAGVYGPVLLERRRHSTQQGTDAHTAVAAARKASHSWLRVVQRAVQDLQAGRTIDVGDFDQATESVMSAVTAAVADLARPGVEFHRVSSGLAGWSGSAISGMWELTRQLREVAVGLADVSELNRIESQALNVRATLGHLLQGEIEARTGHPLPGYVSQQPTTNQGFPPPHDPRV
ncbi:hypothetical protein ABTZ57_01500 [Streptomyces sp. NPDC094048]|uniref:hypothetical protein n=1 Tax=unclassified Streptomyces TaxID=2593676 RepID=UPI0033214044